MTLVTRSRPPPPRSKGPWGWCDAITWRILTRRKNRVLTRMAKTMKDFFHARSCKRPDTALTHSQACDCRSWQPTAATSRAFSRGRKKLAWPLADAISHLLCNFAIDQVLRGRRMAAAYAAVISEVPVSLRFSSYPRTRRETDWDLGKMSQLVARNGTASRLIHRGEAQQEKGLPKVLAPELGVAGFGQRLSGRLAAAWPYTLNCPVRAVLERRETWTERVLGRPERLGLALHCFFFFLFLFMCLCRSTC